MKNEIDTTLKIVLYTCLDSLIGACKGMQVFMNEDGVRGKQKSCEIIRYAWTQLEPILAEIEAIKPETETETDKNA